MIPVLPPAFLTQMRQLLKDETESFLNALETQPPVSVRYNPAKRVSDITKQNPVPWATDAYYLEERISFTADPLFHAGLYYVQEASSMLVEQAFKHAYPGKSPLLTLDLCAAPGGKSTHLLSLLNNNGILISNEIHPQRNAVLRQNLARWGYANSIVTQLPASGFNKLQGMVDLLLCDAPCSGEGLFRKDPDAINEWSPENVRQCAHRQSGILQDISDLVRPGGFLIYSTCTYNSSENDDRVQELIESGNWKLSALNLESVGAVKCRNGWQCFPHRVKGEGFYICLLEKTDGIENTVPELKLPGEKTNFNLPASFPEVNHVMKIGSLPFLLPGNFAQEMYALAKLLPVKSAGILLGEIKGSDLVPSAESALALFMQNQFAVALNREEALSYLRCDNIRLPEAPKGWQLVSFQNHPLGWVKVLDGRVNNYFPKNWRILKTMDRL